MASACPQAYGGVALVGNEPQLSAEIDQLSWPASTKFGPLSTRFSRVWRKRQNPDKIDKNWSSAKLGRIRPSCAEIDPNSPSSVQIWDRSLPRLWRSGQRRGRSELQRENASGVYDARIPVPQPTNPWQRRPCRHGAAKPRVCFTKCWAEDVASGSTVPVSLVLVNALWCLLSGRHQSRMLVM